MSGSEERQLSNLSDISNLGISGLCVIGKKNLSNGNCNLILENGKIFEYDYKKAFNVNFPKMGLEIHFCGESCSSFGGKWCQKQPGNIPCTGKYIKFETVLSARQEYHRRGYNEKIR